MPSHFPLALARLACLGDFLFSITYDTKVIQMVFVGAKVAWATLPLVGSANCKFRALR